MKRLIIICEGPTEQAFCNDLLRDYFQSKYNRKNETSRN